jgi:hypothetical protein
MAISPILKSFLLTLLLALPAAAQDYKEVSEDDYKQLMQQAMKSGTYSQSQSQDWDARLKVVSGVVMIKTVDTEDWNKVTGEVPLEPNDSVKTSADGQAEIYLDDKGVVSLNSNTELEISSLDQEDSVLSLSFGSLVAKIKHFLNEKQKFKVRTPSAVCAVRGTEFAVEYSKMSKESGVGVFDEGRVAVTQADESGPTGEEYLLEKNSEILFDPARKRFRSVPLSRLGRHRGVMTGVRKRLAGLKGWKPRTPSRRAALRALALKRKVMRKDLDDGKPAPKKKLRGAIKKRLPAKAKRQVRPASYP